MLGVNIFLGALGSYAVTSLILFYNPDLIHKKRNKRKWTKKIRHISHRGGAGENLENTITAFRHAVNLGTDMLELDCHLTKDKQVVVVHDANLLRVAGTNANVRDLDFDQLPILKKTISIDFDPGQNCTCPTDGISARKIPLLRQVFDEFPNTAINIDLKDESQELIHEVNKLVTKYQREELTVWGSFREDTISRCYKENPDIGLFFSMRGVIKLLLYFYTGLLPFVGLRETHLEIFLPDLLVKRKGVHVSKLTRPRRLFLWIISALIIRPALFEHLEKRGIQTYVWVLNHEEDFEVAVRCGATGIMTDYPTKLRKFYENLSAKSE